MRSQPPRRARLIQPLVFYLEPQLLLLESEKGRKVLALAVPHPKFHHAFFAAEIRDNIMSRYFDGKADLNYTLRNAAYDKYYLFDLSQVKDNDVEMQPFPRGIAEERGYFPDPGAFARSHTLPYNTRDEHGVGVRTFFIDGNWQANDFSHFHSKVANLYGLFSILARLDGDAVDDERDYVRTLIRERFWRGGGSYVGFYDQLYDHVRSLQPLEVKAIQYQSPGQISFRGNMHALAEIDQVVEKFSDGKHRELDERYAFIYGILQKEGLLRESRRARFSSPAIANRAKVETIALAERLGLERTQEILEACDSNIQIFCKVILSIYRRADELFTFHAEGRVLLGEN